MLLPAHIGSSEEKCQARFEILSIELTVPMPRVPTGWQLSADWHAR